MEKPKIEVKGTIDKVVRQNGKTGAQIVVTIPALMANDIPMGGVIMTIEKNQTALNFPKKPATAVRTGVRRGGVKINGNKG